MKNNKGFTFIELLAVIVILGLIMLIAIPNTISMIDRNRATNYIENAKTFISLAQNKVQIDKSLELPVKKADSDTVLIVTLGYLNTNDLVEDPYGGEYNKVRSFVAVTYEDNEYKYYVHLISCADGNCDCEDDGVTNCDFTNLNRWRGIEWASVDNLNSDSRFDYVRDSDVNTSLANLASEYTGLSTVCTDNLGCADVG